MQSSDLNSYRKGGMGREFPHLYLLWADMEIPKIEFVAISRLSSSSQDLLPTMQWEPLAKIFYDALQDSSPSFQES